MDVIRSSRELRFPEWRVWFYEDDQKQNIILRWLREHGASHSDHAALQVLIDICECSGVDALSYCREELGDGFFALNSRVKGGLSISPVFCVGPFSRTEITFLAGALRINKKLKPGYAAAIAAENLEELLKRPGRRRRERVIRET